MQAGSGEEGAASVKEVEEEVISQHGTLQSVHHSPILPRDTPARRITRCSSPRCDEPFGATRLADLPSWFTALAPSEATCHVRGAEGEG